jgi:CBS domain-containing protein
MKIKDRPEYSSKTKPLAFTPTTRVDEAVREMARRNFGSCVVVNDDDTVAGIVTERDLLKRVLAENRSPAEVALSDIMTTEVKIARADDNLIDWLRQMSNERFRHLPIVDEYGKLVNMMSQGDFVAYTWPDLMVQMKETTKAVVGPNYQILLIVLAILVYALIMPVIFNFV